MRVVSLVPSWTETLLEAGVNVVGRTRFCLHPRERVKDIPRVGGTKDWNWPRIQALKPDLLILDQEENPKFMAEQTEIPYLATHVTSVGDLPKELERLATATQAERLRQMAEEWREVLSRPVPPPGELPGVIEWGQQPTHTIDKIVYVIWRAPWMRVGRETFIGSVLARLNVGLEPGKYPEFDPKTYDPARTLLLFSSEPFPFLKHRAECAALGFAHAFVDGEKFSWFGTRSFRFLQSVLTRTP
jgi:hypothetical protein